MHSTLCIAMPPTLAALDGKDVPNYVLELIRDYYKDRELIYDTDNGRKSYVLWTGFGTALNTVACHVRWCTEA